MIPRPTPSTMVHVPTMIDGEQRCLAAVITGLDYGRGREDLIYMTIFPPTGGMTDTSHRTTAPPTQWHYDRDCLIYCQHPEAYRGPDGICYRCGAPWNGGK